MKKENTFPFVESHITKFKEELTEAGSFVALMLEKKAIKIIGNDQRIARYADIESYKQKFLVGVYESLQPFYDTELPYVFWSALYEIAERVGRKGL